MLLCAISASVTKPVLPKVLPKNFSKRGEFSHQDIKNIDFNSCNSLFKKYERLYREEIGNNVCSTSKGVVNLENKEELLQKKQISKSVKRSLLDDFNKSKILKK